MTYQAKLLLYFSIPCLIWGTLFLLVRFRGFSIRKSRISLASYLTLFSVICLMLLLLKSVDANLDLIVLGSVVAGAEWLAWRERRNENRQEHPNG